MLKRIIFVLLMAALTIAGCRVRSAGEEKAATAPPSNLAINYNLGTPATLTDEILTAQAAALTAQAGGGTETATLGATATSTLDATATETLFVPPSPTATATLTASLPIDTTATDFPTSTASYTATFTATIQPSSTSTQTATFAPTNTATNQATFTNTPTVTFTPSPTLDVTLTITPFPPASATQQGISQNNGGIGGGDDSVTSNASLLQATSTPTLPVVTQQVAQIQFTATLNPNQLTSTAAIVGATQTAAATQGTFFPTSTIGIFDPNAQGPFVTATPTVLYPDCQHYIEPGSTLGSISRLYDLSIEAIMAANPALLTNPDYIKAGDYITIPACGRAPKTPTPTSTGTLNQGTGGIGPPAVLDNTNGPISYTVQAGDGIYNLSIRFGVTMSEILSANPQISDINLISVGQVLMIPRRSQALNTTLTPTPGGVG